MGLLDVATVVTDDGNWTAGYEIESWACGIGVYITDICTPSPIHVAGSTYRDEGTRGSAGFIRIEPFAFTAGIVRDVRCEGTLESTKVAEYLAASEKPIAQVFGESFAGFTGETLDPDGVNVGKPSITMVTTVGGQSDIVTLLDAWSDKTTKSYSNAILHLGLKSAFTLLTQDNIAVLNSLGVRVAISPGYLPDMRALTGDVAVRLSSIQTLKETDATHNKTYIEATRLAAVEFDPCLAFRIGT